MVSLRAPVLGCFAYATLNFWKLWALICGKCTWLLSFFSTAEGWVLFPWWGLGAKQCTFPGFSDLGLEEESTLLLFLRTVLDRYFTILGGGPATHIKILKKPTYEEVLALKDALKAKDLYSTTDLHEAIAAFLGEGFITATYQTGGIGDMVTQGAFFLGLGFTITMFFWNVCVFFSLPLIHIPFFAVIAFFLTSIVGAPLLDLPYDYVAAMDMAVDGHIQFYWPFAIAPYMEMLIVLWLCWLFYRAFKAKY